MTADRRVNPTRVPGQGTLFEARRGWSCVSVGSLAALPTLTPGAGAGAGALLGVITKQAIRLRDLQIGRPPHSEDQRLHRHLDQRLQAVCLDLRRPEQS